MTSDLLVPGGGMAGLAAAARAAEAGARVTLIAKGPAVGGFPHEGRPPPVPTYRFQKSGCTVGIRP